MTAEERLERLRSFFQGYDFLKNYDWSIQLVDDKPVMVFDTIYKNHIRSLKRIFRKHNLEHIYIAFNKSTTEKPGKHRS